MHDNIVAGLRFSAFANDGIDPLFLFLRLGCSFPGLDRLPRH